jgi:hypothetical protein
MTEHLRVAMASIVSRIELKAGELPMKSLGREIRALGRKSPLLAPNLSPNPLSKSFITAFHAKELSSRRSVLRQEENKCGA